MKGRISIVKYMNQQLKFCWHTMKYCWHIILIIFLVVYFGIKKQSVNYSYLEDVKGIVETLPTIGGGDIYRNVFKIRLKNDVIVEVDTPAFLGIMLDEEVTVKVYVNSKNTSLRKYQYIPPTNLEEECLSPCKPIRVGR